MSQEENNTTLTRTENSTIGSSPSGPSSPPDSPTTRRECEEVIDVTGGSLVKGAMRKRKEREEDDIERDVLETISPDKKRERMNDGPKGKEKEEKKGEKVQRDAFSGYLVSSSVPEARRADEGEEGGGRADERIGSIGSSGVDLGYESPILYPTSCTEKFPKTNAELKVSRARHILSMKYQRGVFRGQTVDGLFGESTWINPDDVGEETAELIRKRYSYAKRAKRRGEKNREIVTDSLRTFDETGLPEISGPVIDALDTSDDEKIRGAFRCESSIHKKFTDEFGRAIRNLKQARSLLRKSYETAPRSVGRSTDEESDEDEGCRGDELKIRKEDRLEIERLVSESGVYYEPGDIPSDVDLSTVYDSDVDYIEADNLIDFRRLRTGRCLNSGKFIAEITRGTERPRLPLTYDRFLRSTKTSCPRRKIEDAEDWGVMTYEEKYNSIVGHQRFTTDPTGSEVIAMLINEIKNVSGRKDVVGVLYVSSFMSTWTDTNVKNGKFKTDSKLGGIMGCGRVLIRVCTCVAPTGTSEPVTIDTYCKCTSARRIMLNIGNWKCCGQSDTCITRDGEFLGNILDPVEYYKSYADMNRKTSKWIDDKAPFIQPSGNGRVYLVTQGDLDLSIVKPPRSKSNKKKKDSREQRSDVADDERNVPEEEEESRNKPNHPEGNSGATFLDVAKTEIILSLPSSPPPDSPDPPDSRSGPSETVYFPNFIPPGTNTPNEISGRSWESLGDLQSELDIRYKIEKTKGCYKDVVEFRKYVSEGYDRSTGFMKCRSSVRNKELSIFTDSSMGMESCEDKEGTFGEMTTFYDDRKPFIFRGPIRLSDYMYHVFIDIKSRLYQEYRAEHYKDIKG